MSLEPGHIGEIIHILVTWVFGNTAQQIIVMICEFGGSFILSNEADLGIGRGGSAGQRGIGL